MPTAPETGRPAGEIKRYHRIKVTLSVASILIGFGFLWIILLTGFSARLETSVRAFTARPVFAMLSFCLILGSMELVVLFPLSLYGGFIVEHRFKLSNQSFGRWCWEELKGLLVGCVLFVPILMVFGFFLHRNPATWWIPVGGILFFFSVVLTKVGPVLLFPLFYRFNPVGDSSLVERLEERASRAGLRLTGIYSFNLSKNTRKANAAFAGLGNTRRILLSDTLLEKFTNDEIMSVIGHELGHYKHGHLWKGIVLGFFFTFGGLGIANLLYRGTMGAFGGVTGAELRALPLLIVYLFGYGLFTAPLQNALSRSFERQADRFVLEGNEDTEAFLSALRRLGRINKSDSDPHPLVEFFFYSHPPLKKRIAFIQSLQERRG